MEAVNSGNVVLVVSDSNFVNLCRDPSDYVLRLKKIISERKSGGATIMTVSGRYGLSNIDPTIGVIQVDDKNKTLFGQTLENVAPFFDELLVVTISSSDPYILAAKEVVTNSHKTLTQYGYNRRD